MCRVARSREKISLLPPGKWAPAHRVQTWDPLKTPRDLKKNQTSRANFVYDMEERDVARPPRAERERERNLAREDNGFRNFRKHARLSIRVSFRRRSHLGLSFPQSPIWRRVCCELPMIRETCDSCELSIVLQVSKGAPRPLSRKFKKRTWPKSPSCRWGRARRGSLRGTHLRPNLSRRSIIPRLNWATECVVERRDLKHTISRASENATASSVTVAVCRHTLAIVTKYHRRLWETSGKRETVDASFSKKAKRDYRNRRSGRVQRPPKISQRGFESG